MPRFDPVSEDSDEEVVMSSSKAHSKTSPVPFGGGYKSGNLPKKTARSAREIVDSDDDDDDDDDDGVMTGPSRSRRSLDTGAMQRPGPSRSSAGVTPALSDATESRRQSLSEKLGFTKKKASTGSEQTGWNSRRSSSQGSFSRKGSANAAASGPFRGNIEENNDDDDDSDDDIVMSSFRNKKSSSAAREDRKPTLKKQEATERKRKYSILSWTVYWAFSRMSLIHVCARYLVDILSTLGHVCWELWIQMFWCSRLSCFRCSTCIVSLSVIHLYIISYPLGSVTSRQLGKVSLRSFSEEWRPDPIERRKSSLVSPTPTAMPFHPCANLPRLFNFTQVTH